MNASDPGAGNQSNGLLTDQEQIARQFTRMGYPAEKARVMAAQLEKRARQLSARTGRPLDEAWKHLLDLMQRGGWTGFPARPSIDQSPAEDRHS